MSGKAPRGLTHVDEAGAARMVDVSDKPDTERLATARARITMNAEAFAAICEDRTPKGDVLAAARLAGIMGAKRTSDLIPLCHPLPITGAKVDIAPDEAGRAFDITASVRVTGKTGVEMEALVAASVAALTIYDMAKALDRAMAITEIRLVHKEGGKANFGDRP